MKLLDRYVMREMLTPLLIGTLSFVFMFQANLLIALFKELNLTYVPPAAILQFVLLKTPGFLQMTLPIGMALASSLAFSRLARESELTAIRGAGGRVIRTIWPVALLGVLVSIANIGVTEGLMPRAELRSRQLLNELNVLAALPPIKQNVMLTLGRYTARFGKVYSEKDQTMSLLDVLLIEELSPGEYVITTSAQGTYDRGEWVFEDVIQRHIKGTATTAIKTNGPPIVVHERVSVPDFMLSPQSQERSIAELRQDITDAVRQKRETSQLELTYHTKFSVPFSCFVFCLTGPAMAIAATKRGMFAGVLLSLGLVLFYYNLFIISTQILAKNAWLPPVAAAWLPNLVLTVIGLFFLGRSE